MTESTPPLTLMVVHAHPDDESSSTGGILARYRSEGVRTIVVTCTNGEWGDGPGGVKPGGDGHDPDDVARTRLAELDVACEILDVSAVEKLGYHDSGIPDWEYKDEPESFCNVPLDDAVARLSELFEQYQPDVVVSYDNADSTFYEHPDHTHASRATQAAVVASGIPKKAYAIAMRRSDMESLREVMAELGVEFPDVELDAGWAEHMDALEARITTTVDTMAFVPRKREALAAHASQIQESFFTQVPDNAFAKMFGRESFIRVYDTTGGDVPEDDLFAGLRSSIASA